MSAIDGGAAFPVTEWTQPYDNDDKSPSQVIGQSFGMSLRDYFAGQAHDEALATLNWYAGDEWTGANVESRTKALAAMKYKIADAMIAARVK